MARQLPLGGTPPVMHLPLEAGDKGSRTRTLTDLSSVLSTLLIRTTITGCRDKAAAPSLTASISGMPRPHVCEPYAHCPTRGSSGSDAVTELHVASKRFLTSSCLYRE